MFQAIFKLVGNSASGVDVPDRVRLAIAEQQDAAERLIAWIQFGIIVTFGILYSISPKTSDIDPWMTPVGMSLGAYFVFSVFRVWLAYRIRLPAWFLSLSVAADLTLLMMLIWSFHIQYDQPASFYLKAPTLLYVFIFIALRALRFEARFVLLAGIFSALGWLILVFYVISIDPQDNMITRDYVAYMTSNTILLGAEFDKIISILMVTGILATFGAVLSSDSYAADALRAVDTLIEAADAWNADRAAAGQPPISVGMAVVTGRIIFGAVGDDTRLEYTVIGDPVNLCAKLEKHNRTALTRALTTCEAFDLAAQQGYAAPATRERRSQVAIEGVSAGVDLVVIAAR